MSWQWSRDSQRTIGESPRANTYPLLAILCDFGGGSSHIAVTVPRARAHESISEAQGLELVLREASASHITACRLVWFSRQAR